MSGLHECTCGDAQSRTASCIACRYRLCALLDNDDRSDIQRFRTLERGERIGLDAANHSHVWIVISGTLALCSALSDGRRQIIGLEMAGDAFCSLPAATGAAGWLEALCDCRVCEIDLSAAQASRVDPSQLEALLTQVHGHLGSLAQHVVTLGRLDSTERICLFLTDMAHRCGLGENGRLRVSLMMSREDIADYLGLNPETVSRLFGRVKKAGLVIFLSPTEYLVPDMAALQRRCPIEPFTAAAARTRAAARCGPAPLEELA